MLDRKAYLRTLPSDRRSVQEKYAEARESILKELYTHTQQENNIRFQVDEGTIKKIIQEQIERAVIEALTS